jgi:YVTN family beta-propeller protein
VADNGLNHGSHVTPIATATNKPGKSIKIGIEANWIAVTPDGKTVYVTDPIGGTVTAIATATNTAIARIMVGGYPTDIAFGP